MNPQHRANKENEQPLRSVAPFCYERLIEEFKAFHLHPYDVLAGVIAQDGGYVVSLRFGDNMKHMKEQYFTNEMIMEIDQAVIAFFREAGESCKKALIADYYKMMKP